MQLSGTPRDDAATGFAPATEPLRPARRNGLRPPGIPARGISAAAALWLGAAGLALLTALMVAGGVYIPSPTSVAAAVTVYAAVCLAVGFGAPAGAFGWPNLVTLVRAVLTAGIVGHVADVALAGMVPDARDGWIVAGLAAVALLLDGLDGWLARRSRRETPFGARFDMETDALLILALSVLAAALDKAWPFVLAIGAMRYGFVAAGWLFPVLAGPLPPALRRKVVCVVQGVVLVAIVSPAVAPPTSGGLAFAALLLLAWSFAVDILWRLRLSRREPRS